MNYFELFELPVTLLVDPAAIRQKYYVLSRKYHPDYYAQASPEVQADALEKSSMVNKAYRVFLDPDETIRYVLQLNELIEEEEKYALDPDFLMEVMEINEALMESSEESGLEKVRADAAALMDRIRQDIAPVIAGYQEGKTSRAELLRVKDYYYKKKYIRRILDALEQKSKQAQ